MSGRIVGEILDNAPADLTPAQMLVLLALGEAAHDDTRRASYACSLADLTRRTRLPVSTVKNTLTELTLRRGLIRRVHKRVHRGGKHQEYDIARLSSRHRFATFEPTQDDAHTQRFAPTEETPDP